MELIGLPYSPWSEKARWALDACDVPYRFRSYQPLVGEPRLRLLTRRLRGNVSVPVLRDGARVIADSFAIARYADERGVGPKLVPEGREAEVARWNDLAERALRAGRAVSLQRMLDDGEALAEMVPRPLRAAFGPLARHVGAAGVRRTFRKYGCHLRPLAEHRADAVAVLDELRAALANASHTEAPRALLGRFSFADIAMAQTLGFVKPPQKGLRLGRASRRAFTDPGLAEQYADLVAWRDAIYELHR